MKEIKSLKCIYWHHTLAPIPPWSRTAPWSIILLYFSCVSVTVPQWVPGYFPYSKNREVTGQPEIQSLKKKKCCKQWGVIQQLKGWSLQNRNSTVDTGQLGGKKNCQANMGMKNSSRLQKIALENVQKIRKQTFEFQHRQFKAKTMKREKQSVLFPIAILVHYYILVVYY